MLQVQPRSLKAMGVPSTALECWDLSIPKQYMVQKGIYSKDEIDEMEIEYKRYIGLVIAHGRIPMPPKLDEFWHNHVLFTKDYAAMCEAVVGHFIHHDPSILDEISNPYWKEGGHRADIAKNLMSLYFAEFGEKANHRIWNMQQWRDCCSGSCDSPSCRQ